MKKYLFVIFLGLFGTMSLIHPVLAASDISFNPANVTVRQNQIFNLTIGVDPQEAKKYTAKMEIGYPADILEVRSFVFAEKWLSLTQPDYDLIDNRAGKLVKTAGYPGGFSSPVVFGTISFVAKESGQATIILSDNSFVLDEKSENTLSVGSVRTIVNVSKSVNPNPPLPPSEEAVIPVVPEGSSEETTFIQPTLAPGPNPLLATVSNAITLGTGNNLVGATNLFLGEVITYLACRFYQRKKK